MSDIMPDDWPECEKFYNLMQTYRHVNQHHFDGEGKTNEAYEAVKQHLRNEVSLFISRQRAYLRYGSNIKED